MTDDPFALLGLPPGASADDVAAARRRLAKRLHPDVGGDGSSMRAVNRAAEQALSMIAAGTPRAASAPAAARGTSSGPTAPGGPGPSGPAGRVVHDVASFTVEALPAESFEALVVATSWLGEVLVDDPPYLLEVHLHEPAPCWCRLELVPDAGASTVSLTVAPVESGVAPDLDDVRDAWIDALNQLDWGGFDTDPGRPGPGRSGG